MNQPFEKRRRREAFRIYLRALRDIRRYCPGSFGVITVRALVEALSPYVTIYLTARILNELASSRRPEILQTLVVLTLASAFLLTLLTGAMVRWSAAKSSQYFKKIERIYTDKFLHMDFAQMDSAETHGLYAHIQQTQNWRGFGFYQIYESYEKIIRALFGAAGAIVLTVSLFVSRVPASSGAWVFLNHPLFAPGIALILILLAWLSPACRNKAESYALKHMEAGKQGNRLFGAFGFICTDDKRAADFRIYNQQDLMAHYMSQDKTFQVGGPIAGDAKRAIGGWAALGQSLSAVITGLVYLFVGLKSWAGAFGVGAVTQYVGAVSALMQHLSALVSTAGMLKINNEVMRTVYQFLDLPNEMYQGSLTTEKRSDREYDIEFRDVSFKYPGSENWALRHVNVKFKVGKRLAVVGENGSGKTTFIKLLCRLYDPQEGEILLNGIDIRKYNYRDYMSIFSVVFQDFQLLSQPLGANVAGRMHCDRARAEKALREAGFGERLRGMNKGLDTMLYKDLDEEGTEVSGGEAQKIAIARALYKDAAFIILDEPTAALDPVAEAEIYSKFDMIANDKTAVYISHRLSSCKFCDEIVVFHQGQLIQQGTHEALLAESRGKYYELWNAQAQYYTA